MSADEIEEIDDLDRAIAEVYGGPLDGFVARRDALVKQLRAAKRADDAGRVKAVPGSARRHRKSVSDARVNSSM